MRGNALLAYHARILVRRLRASENRNNRAALVLAFGLSLGLHIPLLLSVSAIDRSAEPLESTDFNTARDLQVNVVEESEDESEETDEVLQHVSAPAPEQEERPEIAEFLDQYDSATEQQTVRQAQPGSPAEPAQKEKPREQADRPEEELVEEASLEEPQSSEEQESEASEELAEDAREPAESSEESPIVKRENVPESGGQVDPQSLFPNFENTKLRNPQGQNGSIDYLRDVDEGDKTVLNRKRSRYWAFFDRLKLQIAQQWSPQSEYRKRDPYGNVYGVKDRYSTVRVTLNGDGSVRKLYVERPSGLDFYDDEAIRSIRVAAPFHNPPEGLKDEDGLIHFSFGFYFEITSGSSFRIFR